MGFIRGTRLDKSCRVSSTELSVPYQGVATFLLVSVPSLRPCSRGLWTVWGIYGWKFASWRQLLHRNGIFRQVEATFETMTRLRHPSLTAPETTATKCKLLVSGLGPNPRGIEIPSGFMKEENSYHICNIGALGTGEISLWRSADLSTRHCVKTVFIYIT